ncbi:MAG: hypothetical protein P4M02_08080 [Clostridia bacterium]|nr:hypothetical protein [Clostridia bacterium]
MHLDEDDSDVKIAGCETRGDEAGDEAEELRRQHENGNLDLARELGKQLSQRMTGLESESSFGIDLCEDEDLCLQRRLLFAFSACYAVECFVPGKLLQDVAVNAFYNALKNTMPEFYGDLDSSGSFSFYYLCVRRSGEVSEAIGHTFAMLSGKNGEPVIERLGEALFIRFSDVVREMIAAMQFRQD